MKKLRIFVAYILILSCLSMNVFAASTFTLQWTYTDTDNDTQQTARWWIGNDTVTYATATLKGEVVGSATSAVVDYSTLADGTYQLNLIVYDGYDWSPKDKITFNVDSTPPTGTISGNPIIWTSNNITLILTANDGTGSGVKRIQLPSGTWVNGSTAEYTVTANGTYTFNIEDNVGNIGSASANVTLIDKTAPTVPAPTVTVDSRTQITVQANATDAQSGLHAEPYQYNRNNTDIGGYQAGPYIDTGLTPNTQYTYKYLARDTVGNISGYSDTTTKYTLAANPVSVKILENRTDSIRIQITNSVNGVVPSSRIAIKAKGTGTEIAVSDWSKSEERIISELVSGQKYDIYINTRNEDGVENGEIKLSSTSEPVLQDSGGNPIDEVITVVEVANFRITDTSINTIRVDWTKTAGQEYQVYLKNESNEILGRSAWLEEAEQYVFASIGLMPNTKYVPYIITRLKDNEYSTPEQAVTNMEKTYTDAEGIGRARFTPGEDYIEIELAVETLDNPADTDYIIKNDITGQTATVAHADPVWTNRGLAKESEYEYSVKVVNKNLKDSYFTRLIFENGTNDGKSAHTIIEAIEIPDGAIPIPDPTLDLGLINPGDDASDWYTPENMEGDVIIIDGTAYIITRQKKVTIGNDPEKPIINTTEYSISTNNIGFNVWDAMNSDGTFLKTIMLNTPGYYNNQIKFKNSMGRESTGYAEVNYIADWMHPEVTAEKKIPYQTASDDTFTALITAEDNVSPILLYSVDDGDTWIVLSEGTSEITFPLEKSAEGILNNLTIYVGDLCGNITEKTFAIWGITD